MSKHMTYMRDALDLLHDAATAVTASGIGQVGGSNGSVALGSARIPDGSLVVVNITACDAASADETYQIDLYGSNDDFSTEVLLCSLNIVRGTTGLGELYCTNEHFNVTYTDLRIKHTLGGTTPSLTYNAWLSRRV